MILQLAAAFTIVLFFACRCVPREEASLSSEGNAASAAIHGQPIYKSHGSDFVRWSIQAEYPHDPKAFTQGLELHGGYLYESTGLYGNSEIRRIDPKVGVVRKSFSLNKNFFGEGITIKDDMIYMLSWRERTGFIFNASNLQLQKEFTFRTTRNEGWGIAEDERGDFIVSDGSSYLHRWDSGTMAELERIQVRDPEAEMEPVGLLNELEHAPALDCILANIWYKDKIACIDASKGIVKATFDLERLYPMSNRPKTADCMNGIAVVAGGKESLNSGAGRLLWQDVYITGKLWDKLFKVRLEILEGGAVSTKIDDL